MHDKGVVGKVFVGAFWSVLSGVGVKVISFLGQIVLAWYLIPEDFGLAAMASSLLMFTSLFSAGSMKAVLIRHFDEFDRLASQVLWLGIGLHLLAGLALVLSADYVATLYGDPRVANLLVIVGLTVPFGALPHPYVAKLQGNLQFKKVSMIHFVEALLLTSSSVAMAYADFGAYSLVLPKLWVAIVSAVLTRIIAGPIALLPPSWNVWRYIMGPTLWVTLLAFLTSVLSNAPAFVLGVLRDAAVVGLYFWGFQIASQAIFVIAGNLRDVIFPGLAKFQADREGIAESFIKILTVLTVLVAAVCAAQFLLAAPLIRLIFSEQWHPAIPVVEYLSVGLLLVPADIASISLLLALGRYRLLTMVHGVQICLLLAVLYGVGQAGSPAMIAMGISAVLLLNHLFGVLVSAGAAGIKAPRVLGHVAMAMLSVLPALAVGWLVQQSSQDAGPLMQLLLVMASFVSTWLMTGPWLSGYTRPGALKVLSRLSRVFFGGARG